MIKLLYTYVLLLLCLPFNEKVIQQLKCLENEYIIQLSVLLGTFQATSDPKKNHCVEIIFLTAQTNFYNAQLNDLDNYINLVVHKLCVG